MKSSPFISLAPRFKRKCMQPFFMKASNYTTLGKVESRFCVYILGISYGCIRGFFWGWREGNEQLIISIKLTHTFGFNFWYKALLVSGVLYTVLKLGFLIYSLLCRREIVQIDFCLVYGVIMCRICYKHFVKKNFIHPFFI